MDNMVFKNRTHWARILLRVIVSFGLLLSSIIIVALLRTECHGSTALIAMITLIAINIHAVYLATKKKCSISGEHLIIEEHFAFVDKEVMDIPIAKIDSCELIGYGPYQSIKLSVHGHPYVLRHMRHSAEIVDIINDKMKE